MEHERWNAAGTRREHDLEEIRLLFDRYRRAVERARAMDSRRVAEAETGTDPERERVPVGAGA